MFFKKKKTENTIETNSETVQNLTTSTTKPDNSDLLLTALNEVKGNVEKLAENDSTISENIFKIKDSSDKSNDATKCLKMKLK